MPRRNLIRTDALPYHVVNQANNREWFQLPPQVMWQILSYGCYELSLVYSARVHALVMMSNHFHLIISCGEFDLGELMQIFAGSVTRTYNQKTGRIGHLFKGRYRWSLIDSPLYYAHALKYVYRNPVKAGLCARVEEYPFSTLHGLMGKSHLPFPLTYPVGHAQQPPPFPTDERKLLSWLNSPYRSEDSETIRRALRRKQFKISTERVRKTRSFLGTQLG